MFILFYKLLISYPFLQELFVTRELQFYKGIKVTVPEGSEFVSRRRFFTQGYFPLFQHFAQGYLIKPCFHNHWKEVHSRVFESKEAKCLCSDNILTILLILISETTFFYQMGDAWEKLLKYLPIICISPFPALK